MGKRGRSGRPNILTGQRRRLVLDEIGLYRYYSPKRIADRNGVSVKTIYRVARESLNR